MLFEGSDLLKALPEQFLQVWLLKLMPRWRKEQMLSILVRVIQTNQPMTILLRRFVPQRKILLAISIHSFEAIVLLKKLLLVLQETLWGRFGCGA